MDAAVHLVGLVRASILDVRWTSSNPYLSGNFITGVWTEGARGPCETPRGELWFGWALHPNFSNGNVRALHTWLHFYLSYRMKGFPRRRCVFCFRFICRLLHRYFPLKRDEGRFCGLVRFFVQFIQHSCLVLSPCTSMSSPGRTTDRFSVVQFRIINNWGNPETTCIYRLRVHGEH